MRVLRRLVGEDDDAGELLAAAIGAATRRVVVKRPSGAAPLGAGEGGAGPVSSHGGAAVRYDVYGGRGGGSE